MSVDSFTQNTGEYMDEKLKESIKEEMSKLPKSRQQAINSFDWLKKCQEIGEKYKLVEYEEGGMNEITGLKTEVALVLIGLSDLHTLHRYIDVEIGGTSWQNIENEIIENIFSPIGEILGIIEKYNAY
jgi:hypothetical protein